MTAFDLHRGRGRGLPCAVKKHLSNRFPGVPVFMDLDSIEAGVDFAEAIKSALDWCVVLIALIGPRWLTATDEENCRRLDNQGDYVRFETRTALERCVRVIPVLVDGVSVPRQQQLPAELHELARLNALSVSYDRFEYDETRLTDVIQRVLASAGGGPTTWPRPPVAALDDPERVRGFAVQPTAAPNQRGSRVSRSRWSSPAHAT
jgi:hypothetical protein